MHTPLFEDLLGHGQGIIGSRYPPVEGDHHEYLDDLLRRDAHIQSIAYMRSDLRGELDGGDRQGGDGPIPELQAWTTPDGTVETLRADPVHIRSQIIGGGNGPLVYPPLAASQAPPHLQALLEPLV